MKPTAIPAVTIKKRKKKSQAWKEKRGKRAVDFSLAKHSTMHLVVAEIPWASGEYDYGKIISATVEARQDFRERFAVVQIKFETIDELISESGVIITN